jgi:hypothetical protein
MSEPKFKAGDIIIQKNTNEWNVAVLGENKIQIIKYLPGDDHSFAAYLMGPFSDGRARCFYRPFIEDNCELFIDPNGIWQKVLNEDNI